MQHPCIASVVGKSESVSLQKGRESFGQGYLRKATNSTCTKNTMGSLVHKNSMQEIEFLSRKMENPCARTGDFKESRCFRYYSYGTKPPDPSEKRRQPGVLGRAHKLELAVLSFHS